MYLSLLPFFTLLFATASADNVSTYSQEKCRTALFTNHGASDTTTKSTTQYFTRTVHSTLTPIHTFTPGSATVVKKTTVTSTSTRTLPQTTDTFSTTLSYTATTTDYTTLTFTSSSTSYATTTSTFTTTTVPASSGFVPLASGLVASGYTVAKKARRGVDLAVHDPQPDPVQRRAAAQKIICGSDGSITYDPPQYRGSVSCVKRVQVVTTKVVTSTARFTRTVTAPRPTTTRTSTSTKITTVTITPVAASTTLTFSTTSTLSTTVTSSSTAVISTTSTSTVYAPQPTYYAACASNNIVSFVNNNRIFNIATLDPDNGFSFGNSSETAYACCVQCVQSGSCGGSTFHAASGTCYFFPFGAGTCDPTQEAGTFSTQTGTNVGFAVSNSNCGELDLAS